VKSAVETLSPTRVRLTVEVPFEELKPSVDAAYKSVARQVRVPGFRPGRVPAPIIDQRVGRGVVLEQALQEAVPHFYGEAVRENSVQVLGQPEVEVTEFTDREQLSFTAEVEVRPQLDLPDLDGVAVTVDDADVTEEEIDQQLTATRERFAVLRGNDRPAQAGDYVSLDLQARTSAGAEVPEHTASGRSYEVGSGTLLPGLDDVLAGMSAGETRTFSSMATPGGEAEEVTVTVTSVKEMELPALDDEFAQTASEFDTLDELRTDVRRRIDRIKRYQQGMQARDRALEALLDRVDVPIPEQLLEAELRWRRDSLQRQLEASGVSRAAFLAAEGQTEEELENGLVESARSAIKAQLVLDAVAAKEELGVSEADLTDQLVRRASRLGVPPEQYAQQLMQTGQVQGLMAEVLRGKALARVLEAAVITDVSGRPVDLDKLREDVGEAAETVVDEEADETDETDETDEVGDQVTEVAGDDAGGEAAGAAQGEPAQPVQV
jgi:trigger factor